MSTRNKPASRRPIEHFDVEHGGQRFTVGVGDGPSETFVSVRKGVGSALEAAVRDASVLTSFALQYGCPLDELRGAITREDNGAPSSAIGAILDAISRA